MQHVYGHYSHFILVGVIQGLILSLVLIRANTGVKTSHHLLALFCLLFALITFDDFLMRTKLILHIPHIFGILPPMILLLGPVFSD